MFYAKIQLENVEGSPLSFSRMTEENKPDKLKNEDHEMFEERIWREKSHYDENGNVFIPAISLNHALEVASKMKGDTIKGKGKATYTKYFKSGVRCLKPIYIGKKVNDLEKVKLACSADGMAGGSKRVMKVFPIVKSWKGETIVQIIDGNITKEVFEDFLKYAGVMVGFLRWRPANGGYNGMFKVNGIEFMDELN